MCASTGNRYLDIGLGVALGAVTAGLGFGVTAVGATSLTAGTTTGLTTTIGSSLFSTGVITSGIFAGSSAAAIAGGALLGGATSTALAMLTPQQQDYSQYHQGAYNPIAYNYQQSQITGSGGRQAPALLAAEIKRAKKRREGQAAQGELGLATSLSNTGLQIA